MAETGFLQKGANRNFYNPMSNRSDQIIDSTGTVSERIDYGSLAFRQIERTVLSINKGFVAYFSMIKITEKILSPYLDRKYREKVRELNIKINKLEKKSYNIDGSFNTQEYSFGLFDIYTDKLGLIVDSLSRRGILPKEDVEVIVGSEPEIDETDVYLNPVTDEEIKKAEEQIKKELEDESKKSLLIEGEEINTKDLEKVDIPEEPEEIEEKTEEVELIEPEKTKEDRDKINESSE